MTKINEAQMNPADAKAIFKSASDLKNNSGMGRLFKGLKKDKLDVNDLMQEWLAQGRPDDTRDIRRILSANFGFSEREINKVFSSVFGKDATSGIANEPKQSPIIQKLADYIKKNDIKDDIISFMKAEFGEELGIKESKMMYEDIRRVFMHIAEEERTARFDLIREIEQTHLGRVKK